MSSVQSTSKSAQETPYQKARALANYQLVSAILAQCSFGKQFGKEALESLDDTLAYVSSHEKFRLTHFQALPSTFVVNGFTFHTDRMVSFVKYALRDALQKHCSRGWFSVFVTQTEEGDSCVNVSVTRRRD
jgi:hypothetical protein